MKRILALTVAAFAVHVAAASAIPIRSSIFEPPPSNLIHWRGIIPPCEWPTIETFAAPVAARTRSTKSLSCAAEAAISPVALLP